MVRPIEVSLLGMRIRRNSNSFRAHHACECWTERALVVTKDIQIADAPVYRNDVHVQRRYDTRGWDSWMLPEILGAEQAGFFSGDKDEELRAARLWPCRGGVGDG